MTSLCRLSLIVTAVCLVASLAAQPAPSRELTPDTVVINVQYAKNQPPIELTLARFMQMYNIPGLSVAVIDNYKIVWAKGFGVTAPGGRDPVTTTTLFQAGSISKPVAATGALWLVEHGKLSLDDDVNTRLKSWKVPDNEFTKNEKVTLRRIMSHTAGLTVHGFPGYEVGQRVPTLVQVLNGEKPANTAPIRVDVVPGTRMRYSGGGVTVEQQLMIDVTGQSFPQFMQDTVLSKLGMSNSTYEQPLPADRVPRAATGTRGNFSPIPGKWHVYPEMAAAGLWTTPTDLAKFAIEIALSKQGKANHVLSQKIVREMLTPVPHHSGDQVPSIGLGFFLSDKNSDQFGHDGSDEGFQSSLMMFADSGKGLVIMGNADTFFYITPHIYDWVSHAYGWKSNPVAKSASHVLTLIENLKGTPAAISYYQQLKQGADPQYKLDENSLNDLGYHLLRQGKVDEAIVVFRLNVHEYPAAWNPYDSLAEGYMDAGNKAEAIRYYEKSLAMNPGNTNGAQMLKRLKSE